MSLTCLVNFGKTCVNLHAEVCDEECRNLSYNLISCTNATVTRHQSLVKFPLRFHITRLRHKLPNLRRVKLSLDGKADMEMYIFRAICSTFSSIQHAQSTLPIVQPRNALHVAIMRELWPI